MTTLIDHTDARTADEAAPATTTDPALRLRAAMAAVRLGFTWMGTRKTLTPGQTARAAETFDAEGKFLSAAKKLLDTKHPAFRSVTAARGKAESYWRGVSLPFPEPGVRLVRRDDLDGFALRWPTSGPSSTTPSPTSTATTASSGGGRRTPRVALRRGGLPGLARRAVRRRLGVPQRRGPRLPPAPQPRPLRRGAGPRRRPVRGGRAARRAGLPRRVRRPSPTSASGSPAGDGGGPKVFRDSAVDNLADFFDRFRTLNVRSNDQLDALVAEAQRAVRGVSPQQLRDSGALRQGVASRLADVRSALDGLLVDRPRRRILRAPAAAGGA
ncbi:MAG: hypothetical protein WKF75_02235 [Singulisphaera sp.]